MESKVQAVSTRKEVNITSDKDGCDEDALSHVAVILLLAIESHYTRFRIHLETSSQRNKRDFFRLNNSDGVFILGLRLLFDSVSSSRIKQQQHQLLQQQQHQAATASVTAAAASGSNRISCCCSSIWEQQHWHQQQRHQQQHQASAAASAASAAAASAVASAAAGHRLVYVSDSPRLIRPQRMQHGCEKQIAWSP